MIVKLANVSWDLAANQVTSLTLDGNLILDNPTNLVDGATYILIVTQDASSAFTLTFGSVFKWGGGTAPTISTGNSAVDVLTFISDGTSLYGSFIQDFS